MYICFCIALHWSTRLVGLTFQYLRVDSTLAVVEGDANTFKTVLVIFSPFTKDLFFLFTKVLWRMVQTWTLLRKNEKKFMFSDFLFTNFFDPKLKPRLCILYASPCVYFLMRFLSILHFHSFSWLLWQNMFVALLELWWKICFPIDCC